MKRNSYTIWLLISLTLWALSCFYFYAQKAKLQPTAMVHTIENDLQKRQNEVATMLGNKELVNNLFANHLSELELKQLLSEKFLVCVFDSNQLVFWNDNKISVERVEISTTPTIVKQHLNIYLAQRIYQQGNSRKYIDIFIPIFLHYNVENEYIQSHFIASSDIPASSEILFAKVIESSLVRSSTGTPLFFVHINKEDIKPLIPDTPLVLLVLSASFFLIVSIHFLALYLCRNRSYIYGTFFLIILIAIIRVITYKFGLPFHLQSLEIFSPQIFASDFFLPSFGDLLLNVLALYWIISYMVAQSSKQSNKVTYFHKSATFRWLLFIAIAFALSLFALYLEYLIQALVMDSDISFDTNSFNATDKFTILVLITIAFIARICINALQLANLNFNRLIKDSKMKYAVLVIIGIISVFGIRYRVIPNRLWSSSGTEDLLYTLSFAMGIFYLFLMDSSFAKKMFIKSALFNVIFWSVYTSIMCAVFFKYYINQQERYISRIAFAEKLSRQQDADLELKFIDIANQIKNDTTLFTWISNKNVLSTQDIYKYFSVLYSSSYLSKYKADIFIFKSNKELLTREFSQNFDTLEQQIKTAVPTMSDVLFFRNQINNNGDYLAKIPIANKMKDSIFGYVFIELKIKKNITQSLYPKLLQDQKETSNKRKPNYNYAIYTKGELSAQSGDYNFRFNIGNLPGHRQYWYFDDGDYSELYYRATPDVVYVIVYKDDYLVGLLTIFSFFFVVYLIVCFVEGWFNLLFAYLLTGQKAEFIKNVSLSIRIKYFVLGFTVISFVVIGISTVIFLTDRYKNNSTKQIEQAISNISEVVDQYFQSHNIRITDANISKKLKDPEFVYTLSNIALQQKLDINIYDSKGQLAISTQDNIYNKELLSRSMSPRAYNLFVQKQLYRVNQTESIGLLSFTSIYTSIVNHDGNIVGYINIPSFFSEKALGNQITSLLTTLVNIYTILLLLSSIITFLFINSLTNSLRLVADNLKNVNLKKNELINWPYKDEIGLLVAEYNKMVIAVEQHAISLVKDERQSAWREMAKQVAHEIKNPLTPMKLNIQYLQQAINGNHPDIINMAKRVSASIIEQIDNLNYIASEFSNFAKMPEKNTEKIDLISMLQRIVALYESETGIVVKGAFPDVPVIIYSDKSQMLRIFTNIVQNAADSIPEQVHGEITITLTIESETGVLITIADNGSGVSEEIKHKIFDPYFTTKTSGTGLGLAMTKKIIELWGGQIWFESTENIGTTFYINLPFGA
jgi:two-component system, NtrC family, nitrogen regulation sensor histidine kinase NtrY